MLPWNRLGGGSEFNQMSGMRQPGSPMTNEFARHARGFERWVLESQSEGADVAREALLQLTALYAAALSLPSPWLADTETEHSARVVSDLIGAETRPMPFGFFISGLHQTNPTISVRRNHQVQPEQRVQAAASAVSCR